MRRVGDKQWMKFGGTGVVLAAIALASVSSGSCVFASRTNLCERFDIRCKDGQECAKEQPICIDIGGCGDGVMTGKEVCDDGNIMDGDGCSADCLSNETCGNHIVDPTEECDDGNLTNGDSCSSSCTNEACGDGFYDSRSEQCDTAGDSQACNGGGKCTIPRCGDGYTNKNFTPFGSFDAEQCDDNGSDTIECNGNNHGREGPGSCRAPICGDGYANPMFIPDGTGSGEECDEIDPSTHLSRDTDQCNGDNSGALGPGSCHTPACGDGYTNKAFAPSDAGITESCDNGTADTIGCNGNKPGPEDHPNNLAAQCQTPTCGDGYTNRASHPAGSTKTETCDDGNDTKTCNGNGSDGDDADAKCQSPSCGDGYVNSAYSPRGPNDPETEECDNKGGGNSQTCNGNTGAGSSHGRCRIPSCGDGYLNTSFTAQGAPGPEQCDNGSGNSDMKADACRTNCQNHSCGDGIKDSDEQCDPDEKNSSCTGQQQCSSNKTGPNACKCISSIERTETPHKE